MDGGNVWGVSMGHLKRTLILAEKLDKNFKIYFLMKNYPDGVLYVKKKGWNVLEMEPDQDSDNAVIEICKKYSIHKIILDLNSTPYTELFDYTKLHNISTIVFDITGNVSGHPDIIINDSLVPNFVEYPNKSEITKVYSGPFYFILQNPPRCRPIHRIVRSITLTMGGSDPAGITLKILKNCLLELQQYDLNIILGPAFKNPQEIINLVKCYKNVRIYQDPPQFLSLLSVSDVVITAAGRTLYECAYFGRPSIIVPSIEHESVTAKTFAELSGSTEIGRWDDLTSPIRIIRALSSYSQNYTIRKQIFTKSRQMVKNDGQKRVLNIICNS